MAQPRGQWNSNLGFVLAAAGSAVGLGNLWKFPYIAHHNQGGAFVLIYIAAVAIVGLPIMVCEIILGRRTQQSPVGALRQLSAGRPGGRFWLVPGYLGVLTGFVILSYYCVIAGWTLRYILLAAGGQIGPMVETNTFGTFFDGFLADGRAQTLWYTVFMGLTIGIVYFGVKNGIERVAKTLMPILFAILFGLAIYATTTPGFQQAMHFLFRPNFGDLTRGAVLEALGHSFFTLSLGMGAMLTYGSYMKKDQSIPRAAVTISLLDTLIAILACIIMFSVIFSEEGFEVVKSSTILFTTLPQIFFKLPASDLICAVFYLLVAVAALTSTISLLEVVTSFAIDETKMPRRRAVLTVGGAIYVFGLLNAWSMGGSETLAGVNILGKTSTEGVFGTLDYLASNWFLPVGGFLIALFTGWILSTRASREELAATDGGEPPRWYATWLGLVRFAAPLVVGAIIVSVILGAEYQ